jgi:hypothetical protein
LIFFESEFRLSFPFPVLELDPEVSMPTAGRRGFQAKVDLERAGMLKRITSNWLRSEELPKDLYRPGDVVVVEARREIKAGEVVIAARGDRGVIYRHVPGASEVRLRAGGTDAPDLRVPVSDLILVGVVIGLRRAL